MHCISLSIYLSIHLSICLHIYLDMYASISLSIILSLHSIFLYLSLYIFTIKRSCFQIEQLKLWQKQKILCFENDVILLRNIDFNILYFN